MPKAWHEYQNKNDYIRPFRRQTIDASTFSPRPQESATILLFSGRKEKWHCASLSSLYPKKFPLFFAHPIEERRYITRVLMMFSWSKKSFDSFFARVTPAEEPIESVDPLTIVPPKMYDVLDSEWDSDSDSDESRVMVGRPSSTELCCAAEGTIVSVDPTPDAPPWINEKSIIVLDDPEDPNPQVISSKTHHTELYAPVAHILMDCDWEEFLPKDEDIVARNEPDNDHLSPNPNGTDDLDDASSDYYEFESDEEQDDEFPSSSEEPMMFKLEDLLPNDGVSLSLRARNEHHPLLFSGDDKKLDGKDPPDRDREYSFLDSDSESCRSDDLQTATEDYNLLSHYSSAGKGPRPHPHEKADVPVQRQERHTALSPNPSAYRETMNDKQHNDSLILQAQQKKARWQHSLDHERNLVQALAHWLEYDIDTDIWDAGPCQPSRKPSICGGTPESCPVCLRRCLKYYREWSFLLPVLNEAALRLRTGYTALKDLDEMLNALQNGISWQGQPNAASHWSTLDKTGTLKREISSSSNKNAYQPRCHPRDKPEPPVPQIVTPELEAQISEAEQRLERKQTAAEAWN
ncbi:uncharacterized protein LY89DRAFT_677743 [Mollisia scopiformis]|uniref:Uncharacterized protein n=1 Tax=Mollisia scopiformis TaxID=149040 RepID=A0A132B594_MOLSC|nr:uncharacterized protein LY89DRAFT_677743 [Mollisia scopiformis]KUJ07511.1 hypothetical protein LY89DRAFT_677743 [Mollisia scopiformis]